MSPPPTPTRRSASALLAAIAVVVAVLAVGAAPADAATPGLPRVIKAIGYTEGIRLYFAPPIGDGGSPITKYTISRIKVPGPTVQAVTTWTQPTTAVFTDRTAVIGIGYRYFVTATNAIGTSPLAVAVTTPGATATRPASYDEFAKFSTQAGFVARQYRDFLGRDPSPAEANASDFLLTTGEKTPAELIGDLVADPVRANRARVIRLYLAYFDRGPDHGGLTFWTDQLAAGRKTLNDVSSNFARSSEFATTYGSLSNVAFVTLVYRNVLGRAPELAGLQFWTGQLDGHTAVRGRVMTQFSESSEYRTAGRGRVAAADVWDATLRSTIPAEQLALLGAHVQGGGTPGLVASLLMSFSAYPRS